MSVLLTACDCFLTVIWNCSSLIFRKNADNATCIIGSKSSNLFRGALKIHFDDRSENFLLKRRQFYEGRAIASKLWSEIALVWY